MVDGQFNFQRADTAAGRKQYSEAADAYLLAAQKFQDMSALDAEMRAEWKETLESSRDLAYGNALACFVAAGKRPAGIKAVEAAAAKDPSAKDVIQLSLALFGLHVWFDPNRLRLFRDGIAGFIRRVCLTKYFPSSPDVSRH